MKNKFDVFGEPVEFVVTAEQTEGKMYVVRQICQPGGGPPPHIHQIEDEIFSVVTGRFEIFDGASGVWNEIPEGGMVYSPAGSLHAFRNCGNTEATIQIVVVGGRFQEYLEAISVFTMPQDMQAMVDLSATYGITFPTLPPATNLETMSTLVAQ